MQYYAPLKTASTKAFLVVKCIVMSKILTVIPTVEFKNIGKGCVYIYIYPCTSGWNRPLCCKVLG